MYSLSKYLRTHGLLWQNIAKITNNAFIIDFLYLTQYLFHDFPVSVSASDFNPSPIYPLALWIKDCVNT